MKFPGFIGPTYQNRSLAVDAQRTMNLYPETIESGSGRNVAALLGRPGLQLFTTLPQTPIRALVAGENRLFAVAGARFYEINNNGSWTDRSALAGGTTIGNDGNPCRIILNGSQAGIASAGKFYCDSGVGPVAINYTGGSDPVLAVQIAYLDGYFIAQNAYNSKQWNLSAILDGTTWDPLDFANKEGYPDSLAAILADHEEIWLFGVEGTTEVWRNVGAPPPAFPFQRDPGAFIHYGCLAPHSPRRLRDGVVWLSGDQIERGGPFAVYAEGYKPVRVSTHAVEQAWAGYSAVKDAVSYSYIENGHEFWQISFPTPKKTWVFDATEKLWHERGWWNGTDWEMGRDLFHAYVDLGSGSKHFVADWQNGNIYTMSPALSDDNGTAIHWQRTAPYLSDEEKRIYFHRFQLDAALGLTCSLDFSEDYGATWSNTKSPRAATTTIKGGKRYTFSRLGAAWHRLFRVSGTGGGNAVALVNAYLRTSEGDS